MATMVIEKNRLDAFADSPLPLPAADKLFRVQNVFFVGGNLPVYETLETLFDSFCTEATTLFYLVVGSGTSLPQGEEMARQIKKNFHSRLMARVALAVSESVPGRLYAAGVDNIDFQPGSLADVGSDAAQPLPLPLQAAVKVFPRWGVALTLPLAGAAPEMIMAQIDRLLQAGVVPLVQFSSRAAGSLAVTETAVLDYLLAGWEKSNVSLSAYQPLLSVMSPVVARPAGLIRGLYDRLRDRRQLAESDLRRHLRVQPATDSLDSAGL